MRPLRSIAATVVILLACRLGSAQPVEPDIGKMVKEIDSRNIERIIRKRKSAAGLPHDFSFGQMEVRITDADICDGDVSVDTVAASTHRPHPPWSPQRHVEPMPPSVTRIPDKWMIRSHPPASEAEIIHGAAE